MSEAVSAQLVMRLRERTGAGMMECKKFLVATNGDIEAAVIEMRKAGQAKADKKADRVAAEGVVVIASAPDAQSAVMLEVNSETDFVARDTGFMAFAAACGQTALASNIKQVDELKTMPLVNESMTVEEARQQLVAKIGENIQLRRLTTLTTQGAIGTYLHGTRIGVLVAIDGKDVQVAKDIAMHIAASKPKVIQPADVSSELIEQERVIYSAQAAESGKPQAIIDKMVDGRIQKFLSEISLLDQPFVKNPDLTVGKWLKEKGVQVEAFIRFEVGEGIEKKQDNFVEEVMAQVRDA